MRQNIALHKSLKFKINLLVTILFFIIIVFLICKSNQNQQKMIRTKEDDLNQIAVDTIHRRFKVSYELLETSLAQITVNPLIVDAVALGDTEQLAQIVSKSYDKLKAVGIDEFNFYLPDNSLLLNLHDFNQGEVLMPCKKAIVKDINSDPNHGPIKGIEECQYGLFLRYMAPIYNLNNEYIASVELGMEVESRILNIFKNVSAGEWYLYSFNGKDQSLLKSTLGEDIYPLEINKELAALLDNGHVFKTEESPYIVQIIPISNYKGEYRYYFKHVFDNSELIGLQNEYTKQYIIYGLLAAIFSISILWAAMTYLLNPLIYLEQKVRNLELGELVEAIEVKSNDEIGYLAGAMENMRQSLYERENQLKEQSYIDPLTGVYNRLYFQHNLIEIVEKGLFPTSLIMADIDGLKKINDNHGHGAGDTHIINCVENIKNIMRADDKLFRIGGDEFILLFPMTDKKTAELILARIKKEFEIYNKNLKKDETILSVSFGIGVCEKKSDCLEHTMAVADKNMYENKAKKKNNS